MVTIDIASLDLGIHHVELEPSAEDLNLEEEEFKDVHVLARLDVQERRILVHLDAHAVARLECDRTLVLFDQEVEGEYSVLFAPPGFAGREDDDRYGEVRELLPQDRELDVTDVVRDTLLLALPQRCIAPGAEDEEIQTEFGQTEEGEDDIDPRWEKLRELRGGEDES